MSTLRLHCTYIALAAIVRAAPVPVVEDNAPAASYVTPAPVDKCMAPVPAVNVAPTPVVEYISPAPVGYAAPAPVGEYRAPAIETAVMKISLDRDTCVPDRLQSLESSVVAASKSVARQRPSVSRSARQQVPHVAERPVVVKKLGEIQSRSRGVGTRGD